MRIVGGKTACGKVFRKTTISHIYKLCVTFPLRWYCTILNMLGLSFMVGTKLHHSVTDGSVLSWSHLHCAHPILCVSYSVISATWDFCSHAHNRTISTTPQTHETPCTQAPHTHSPSATHAHRAHAPHTPVNTSQHPPHT